MKAWVSGVVAWGLLSSCGRGKEPAFVVVDAPPAAHLDLGTARVEGSGRSVTLASGKLVLEREAGGTDGSTVRVAGACPLRVAASDLKPGATAHRTLAPWFDFGPDRPEVGFGGRLEVTAAPGCPDAQGTKITWTQTEGEPLARTDVTENGRSFSATMPALEEETHSSRLAIIPLSPRTRGEVALRATWTGPDGGLEEHTVRASAAARSRGLSNVAVSTRLFLSGEGIFLAAAPPGSRSAVETQTATASFTPDVTGSFTLTSARGESLTLYAGRYDETPLDCGRSDCHAGIATSARSSPMATILQRGLDGPFAGDYPSCALGCHTVGEPGVDDGGFLAVGAALGWAPSELRRTGFHALPAALRRLGGVGCLACHGPGTVAEPHGRHALLRAEVCATCHDAPPRYGHVVAWRTTRMARADVDPRARADRACARCHTTWGFLGRSDHAPPDDAPPAGIACAACHAVHPAGDERGTVVGATCAEALRRDAPLPAILEDTLPPRSERSRVCLGCHAPGADESAPSASATAIWAGRGGLEPVSGAPLTAAAQHGNVDGGCIGCHRSGPAGLGHGAGHAFAAHDDACVACHASRSDPSIRERALALWARRKSGAARDAGEPPHRAPATFDRSTPRGRAEWDLALVLEDPAADRHNAPYARALLDAAEHVLGPAPAGHGGVRP